MNDHVHPVFAAILQGVVEQPTLLRRAAAKAESRRFSGEPITDLGALDDKVGEEFRAGLDGVDDERNERLDLEADMARDMARRSV